MKSFIVKLLGAASFVFIMTGHAFCGIGIDDYLKTAANDETLGFQNEKIAFLKTSSSNTPFLNEVELRVKIDEFKSDRQTYAARFKPNGWGEAEDGRRVYGATLAYNEAHGNELFCRALKARYMTVIDYLFNRDAVELNEKLMILYEDRVTVLKRMAGSHDFDGNDLIDAENDIIKLQLDLIDLKNKIANIEDEIRRNAPSGQIEFGTEKIVDIEYMRKFAGETMKSEAVENVYTQNARLNSELAAARYRLERSENRKYIRFVEAEYDLDDRDDFEKAFSIQVGFSIPIVNPNRLDVNRRKLASLKAKSEYENKKKSAGEKIAVLSRALKRLIAQHDVLAAKKKDSGAESSYKIYRKVDGISPLILLKLKESMLKTDIAVIKTRHRLYTKYFTLLDISGKLSEKPVKNYLSANLEEIAQ